MEGANHRTYDGCAKTWRHVLQSDGDGTLLLLLLSPPQPHVRVKVASKLNRNTDMSYSATSDMSTGWGGPEPQHIAIKPQHP